VCPSRVHCTHAGRSSLHLTLRVRHVQHPVLERGGSRVRDATFAVALLWLTLLLELVVVVDERSSLGAMAGRRGCCFAGVSALVVPCITSVVRIVMSDLIPPSQSQAGPRILND
jgi:hypothetical protein